MEVTKKSTNRWVDKEELLYVQMEYSLVKKNEIMPFAATWMDLKIIIPSEMSDRERQILYDISYMRNLKK